MRTRARVSLKKKVWIHKGSVLGADDKLGVYTLIRLIENKVPGLYVFHTGEESGGKGSSHIANETPELVKNIVRCIAFDRRGYTSCITHQGGRCCSDEFAEALCEQLNLLMPPKSLFKPDSTGMFTDSANYTHLIRECTNISVGFFREHTSNEHFDPIWLENIFLPAVLTIKWDKLPTEREKTTYSRSSSRLYGNSWGEVYYGAGKTPHYSGGDYFETKNLTEGTSPLRIPPLSILYILKLLRDATDLEKAIKITLNHSLTRRGSEEATKVIIKLLSTCADQSKVKHNYEALLDIFNALDDTFDKDSVNIYEELVEKIDEQEEEILTLQTQLAEAKHAPPV